MLQVHTSGKNVLSGVTSFEDNAAHEFSGKMDINFLQEQSLFVYLLAARRRVQVPRYLDRFGVDCRGQVPR